MARRNTQNTVNTVYSTMSPNGINKTPIRPKIIDQFLNTSVGFNDAKHLQSRRLAELQKKHWSVSPFNTISDFGNGRIIMKQVYIDADKPKEATLKQGDNTMFIDKGNLTSRIYRD
jgi:hypothetical protein